MIRENIEVQPTQLILSYAYPLESVMSTIIARYVKLFLGAHSARSFSTAKRNNLELNLNDIRRAGVWKTNSFFRKHNELPIHKNLWYALLN